MTTTTDNEYFRRMVVFCYEVHERGFVRHLAYCWLTRRGFPNHSRRCIRTAVGMLRMKRAVAKLPAEELARYGITDLSKRDTDEGWTCKLTSHDLELMAKA
jgi:hypothetical protein